MQFNDLGTQLAHVANEALGSGATIEETAQYLHGYAYLQRGATVNDTVAIATGQQTQVPVRKHGGVVFQGIAEMKAFCLANDIEAPTQKTGRRASWQNVIYAAGYRCA